MNILIAAQHEQTRNTTIHPQTFLLDRSSICACTLLKLATSSRSERTTFSSRSSTKCLAQANRVDGSKQNDPGQDETRREPRKSGRRWGAPQDRKRACRSPSAAPRVRSSHSPFAGWVGDECSSKDVSGARQSNDNPPVSVQASPAARQACERGGSRGGQERLRSWGVALTKGFEGQKPRTLIDQRNTSKITFYASLIWT